jgi:hypothetical protein
MNAQTRSRERWRGEGVHDAAATSARSRAAAAARASAASRSTMARHVESAAAARAMRSALGRMCETSRAVKVSGSCTMTSPPETAARESRSRPIETSATAVSATTNSVKAAP